VTLTHQDGVTSNNTLTALLLKEPKNLTGITATTSSLCHCPVVSLLVPRLQSDFAFKVASVHFTSSWALYFFYLGTGLDVYKKNLIFVFPTFLDTYKNCRETKFNKRLIKLVTLV